MKSIKLNILLLTSLITLPSIAEIDPLQKKCIEYYNLSGKKILPVCKELINIDGTPKDLAKQKKLEEEKRKKEQELMKKQKVIEQEFLENQKRIEQELLDKRNEDQKELDKQIKIEEEKNQNEDKSKSSILDSINKFNMIMVEGGSFMMGDDFGDGKKSEKPSHKVEVSSFYIGKYELTQKEMENIIGINNSNFVGPNLPVDTISWNDATKLCNVLNKQEGLPISYDTAGNLLDETGKPTIDVTKVKGFRLPTEAEWEFAARGGNFSFKSKFSGSNTITDVAFFNENSTSTKTVGTKKANALGLYDMSGNVFEWCSDLYSESFYSKSRAKDPYNSIDGTERVLRGGSWNVHKGLATVYSRMKNKPDYKLYDIGFRLVRSSM